MLPRSTPRRAAEVVATDTTMTPELPGQPGRSGACDAPVAVDLPWAAADSPTRLEPIRSDASPTRGERSGNEQPDRDARELHRVRCVLLRRWPALYPRERSRLRATRRSSIACHTVPWQPMLHDPSGQALRGAVARRRSAHLRLHHLCCAARSVPLPRARLTGMQRGHRTREAPSIAPRARDLRCWATTPPRRLALGSGAAPELCSGHTANPEHGGRSP